MKVRRAITFVILMFILAAVVVWGVVYYMTNIAPIYKSVQDAVDTASTQAYTTMTPKP